MAKKLLDMSAVLTNLGTAAECKVHDVDSISMNEGEGFSAVLGICAGVRQVMAKLEDTANLLK